MEYGGQPLTSLGLIATYQRSRVLKMIKSFGGTIEGSALNELNHPRHYLQVERWKLAVIDILFYINKH